MGTLIKNTKEGFYTHSKRSGMYLFILIFIFLGNVDLAAQGQSEEILAGYKDFNYGTTVYKKPTAEKPESKLWWNDGIWWGVLWSTDANKFRIFKLNKSTQSWENVGPDVDDRSSSLADALWDGQKLYISSHKVYGSGPARLYRYSYDAGTKSYSLDSGFPVNINNEESETLTIAKDSSGQLWATWTSGASVMVNRTEGSDDSWGTPFVLPVQGGGIHDDDISSVVSFGGDKIGIMWSNQNDFAAYFAIHNDGSADSDWESRETALQDLDLGDIADDHLNMKVIPDGGGNVYVATKTGLSGADAPLIYLLKRSADGRWGKHIFSHKRENHTRPIVLIDEENRDLYMFAMSFNEHPRRIWMKKTSLDNISFSAGFGEAFIYSSNDDNIDNPTSTKQNLNSNTGLVVLASDHVSRTYFHNYIDLAEGTNGAPIATADAANTNENEQVVVDVLANDQDLDGSLDNSSVTIVTAPAHGTISDINSSSGAVTYSPNENYSGEDTFYYTVNDDKGAVSNSASVTINIANTNDAPVAANDEAVTAEDSPVSIPVLANDSDPDGSLDNSSVTIVTAPAHGTISNINSSNGEVTYSPNENYFGDDSFAYTVKDTEGAASNSASVTINITSVNDAPIAADDAAATPEATTVTIDVADNDSDVDGNLSAGTVTVVSNPNSGTVSSINATSGAISYLPDTNFSGSDTLQYTIADSDGLVSNAATVIISVSAVTEPPVAANDDAVTPEDSPVSIPVLANDSDPDGSLDNSSVTIVTAPAHGTISNINSSNGEVTYSPNENYFGDDSFAYTVKDADGTLSNIASVAISITSVNDAPIAADDAASTSLDQPVVIDVADNDSDIDGTLDFSSVAVVSSPSNGTITSIDGTTGAIHYSPAGGYEGSDSFSYEIKDENGLASNAATVSITVTGAGPAEVTFYPSDDVYIRSSKATTNYSGDDFMRIRAGSPVYSGYVKFVVSGVGTVTRATLRLYATDGSPTGGDIHLVSNNYSGTSTAWTESGLTAGNAPAIEGSAVGSAGYVSSSSWAEIDVTSAINGPGVYSFSISSTGNNSAFYTTKEGANPPELYIEGGTGGGGGNIAPIANADNAETTEDVSIAINVLANDTDPDGTLDPSSVAVSRDPGNGEISMSGTDGIITYIPDPGFSGTDDFEYTVNDNSGKQSNKAEVNVIVTPVGEIGSTLTLNPTDDAQVYTAAPSRNYGDETTLRIRESTSSYYSYMKFAVSGVSTSIQTATLRLYVTDGSPDGGTFYLTSNNFKDTSSPWTEAGLNAGNAPILSGLPIASVGSVTAGGYIEIDVTTTIGANGVFSFGIQSASGNSVKYASSEHSNQPELVLTLEQAGTAKSASAPVTDAEFARVKNDIPEHFILNQNYPNPFNNQTAISYALPSEGHVTLSILDITGKLVKKLVREVQPRGYHRVVWDGKNGRNVDVSTGVYFYRVEFNKNSYLKKITLIK